MDINPAQDKSLVLEVNSLKQKVNTAQIPPPLKEKLDQMLNQLNRMAKYSGYIIEYERINQYITWVLSLPWFKKTEDILDLNRVREVLDKNHYGMKEIKERILEYMATLRLTRQEKKISHAPILLLVGLVGTGKTTFGYSIAEAMGRTFGRIPFGGMASALDLRGQSRQHEESEPGQVIKTLRRAKNNNPVILLDEIDRVAELTRGDIMGVLVELLDPEQNEFFIDHYLDYPFNLSDVLFVATCNNTTHISPAVLDRMEILQMPSYTDEEKIVIAQKYLLPKAISEAGLTSDNLEIELSLWPKIVRPLGFDAGMRSLERTIEAITRKIAKLVVEGKGQHYHLNATNLKEYLPLW